MSRKKPQKKTRRWVIKIGSALYVDGGPLLVRALMQQVEKLLKLHHVQVIWVTSGAIASARMRTSRQWKKLPEKQALSAIGQPMLMDAYNLGLQSLGLIGAQVLLTYENTNRRKERDNLRNTLATLLEWGVLPILNENDAVATEEIQFGDNDLLSAKVAALMTVDRLIILTNVDGLYDKNPSKHADAKLISHLPKLTKKHFDATDNGASSTLGRGGMLSKLRAAAYAQTYGVPTSILRGDTADCLLALALGQAVGTSIGAAVAVPATNVLRGAR